MPIPSGELALGFHSALLNRSTIRRNDILRKHGVIPEKPPSPTAKIQEALIEARKHTHENRLDDKDLEQLKDLEDEEDEVFLEKYRWVRNSTLSEGHRP